MINWIKNLFRRRIWKETSREFLRVEQTSFGGISKYYLVTYQDVLNGDIKVKEVEITFP
jgi:hypothetical protein